MIGIEPGISDVCKICKNCFIVDCFQKDFRTKSGYVRRCAGCFKDYQTIKQRERRRRKVVVKVIKKVLGPSPTQQKKDYIRLAKSVPCTDCKTSYPFYVMDFDHLPNSIKKFHLSAGYLYSWEEIKEEIIKCEVVCSNCHRARTYLRKQ